MTNQDEQDAVPERKPSSINLQLVAELWHQASEESGQPNLLFEQWVQEIRSWAKLAGWRTESTQGVRARESLWLPNLSETQLQLLLALADLADALGCSASQLTQTLLGSAQASSPLPHENNSHLSHQLQATDSSAATQLNLAKPDSLPTTPQHMVDYQPLVEMLTNWQAIFELALDCAATQLDKEQFPAEALSASLAEMCDLLRAVLNQAGSHEGAGNGQ
jgi:hypothetical protein